MRRGINVAGVFDDAPAGRLVPIDAAMLNLIAGVGFDTVRLPVRWTSHAAVSAPYTIDESFAALVDDALRASLDRGLEVIVDMHHARDVMADPVGQLERFGSIWRQLGERYADLPDTVAFELLNEPCAPMTADQWNRLLGVGLQMVRLSNPTRRVVIGPAVMNTIAGLSQLELPADPRLVATIHYYEPFSFTHQGAPWEPDSAEWLGTSWGTVQDELDVRRQLEVAAAWATDRTAPLVVGEFGAYRQADLDARIRWTRRVRIEAERLGLAWCYWDFATDFGVFDTSTRRWRTSLLDALVGD